MNAYKFFAKSLSFEFEMQLVGLLIFKIAGSNFDFLMFAKRTLFNRTNNIQKNKNPKFISLFVFFLKFEED